MARKSVVQLQADLSTSFPDNTTGLITPAVVRTYLNNFLEAIRPAYGLVSRTAPNTQTIGTTDVVLVGQTASVSDVPDYVATAATCLLDRLEAGMTRITFNTSFECQAGRKVTATLYKNGSPTVWASAATGAGTGDPAVLSFSALSYDGGSADYQIQIKADATGTNVNIYDMLFIAESVLVNVY